MTARDQAAGSASTEPRADAELELKLCGEPEVLRALFAGPAIRARANGRGSSRRLENVYYDTPDRRLRAGGLAFRVRKDGRRYVQTLKSNDAGGLVAWRGEWQVPLASAEPDLRLLPPGASAALDGIAAIDGLRPLFTTRVRRDSRRLRIVESDGRASLVEVALDLGAIEAGGSSQPIAEIELELLEGSPTALYELALELDQLSPLRLETRSKSARGYALAAGEPPAAHKAEPLALRRRATVDDALGAILRSCLQHWCANEPAARHGLDPEGVHQMRVALRRLRSAASVFGPLLAPERRAWLAGGAKRILDGLGAARDWDVFVTDALAPVLAARPHDRQLSALRTAAESARAASYATVRATMDAPAHTRFLLELGRWIEAAGWRADAGANGSAWLARPVVAFAKPLLARRQRKLLRRGRSFAELGPEERHRVRIALKKLRYATEFFHAAYPQKRTKRYLAALKQLQDALGRLNDLAAAERLVGGLVASAGRERTAIAQGSGLVLGWLAREAADLEPGAVELWRDFAARQPFWH